MKPAAIGVRVHSGWGAVVAVAGQNGAEEIIERRKVIIIDAKRRGAAQPYHYVEEMELPAAERHLTTELLGQGQDPSLGVPSERVVVNEFMGRLPVH